MGRRVSAVLSVALCIALALLVVNLVGLPSSLPAENAPATSAELPSGYAGAETCKGCHPAQYETFSQTRMGRLFLHQPRNTAEGLGCENCHGPGLAHAESGGEKGVGNMITFAKDDKTPVEQRNAVCLSCHTKGNRVFWKGSAHDARDVACTSCHVVMENRSARHNLAQSTELEMCSTCHLQKRAAMWRTSHMPVREGKMTCTSGYNPHGTVTPALLRENSLNDNCYRCHTEKRGPFLWTHPPVQESCANCHNPHGSNHESMLIIAKPRLCQQCHIESRHPTNPYGRDTGSLKLGMGRACVNCHANIHGSNHPAGRAYTR